MPQDTADVVSTASFDEGDADYRKKIKYGSRFQVTHHKMILLFVSRASGVRVRLFKLFDVVY